MRKTLCLSLLLCIFTCCLYSQTAEADSLRNLLGEASTPFERANIQRKLAVSLADTLPAQSDDYFKQAIYTSLEIEDKKDQWKSFNSISENAIYNSKIPFVLSILLQLAETLDAEKEVHTIGILKCVIGKLHRNHTNFTEASANLFEALKIGETVQDTQLLINVCFNLCRIYYETVPPDSALFKRYGKMAYDYSTRFSNVHLKAIMAGLMGDMMLTITYMEIEGNMSEARKKYLENQIFKYFGESITHHKTRKDDLKVSYIQARIGIFYQMTGELEKAISYYEANYEMAKKKRNKKYIRIATSRLSDGYLELNTPESLQKAVRLGKENLKLVNQMGLKFNRLNAYVLLNKIYSQLHQYDSAWFYQSKYVVLKDSTVTEEKVKQLAEMETKYETEKKELTIASQEQELAQRQKIQAFSFAGLGLLGLVAFLLFRTARLRRRSNLLLENHNRELARKNTEIEAQSLKIEEKNRQNELLLKEIHHRVKNNLQVISSLLHLQSMHIEDAAALDAVKEGQSRVKSMALIHQKLYQGENLAAIEMQEYGAALLKSLAASFGARPDRIQMVNEIEKMELDVDTAIPLGLIINELVTNSLKYAFPEGRKGSIRLSLQENPDGRLSLEVADDGVGISRAELKEGSTSFGTKLVELLTKKLKGEMEVLENKGTTTRVLFKPI